MSKEFTISIELDDAEINRVFATLTEKATKLRPLMASISEGMFRTTRERFQLEVAPDGTPWAPLKPKTLARKRAHGQRLNILQARGHMLNRIVPDFGDDFAGISVNAIQAALHQFGGTPDMPPGPAAVPARPFLGISDKDRREILQAAHNFLAN